jgi:hypothetical protein
MFAFTCGVWSPHATRLRKLLMALSLLALLMVTKVTPGWAQSTSQPPPADSNKQEAPPEAGGPQNDVGPYAIPKKKEAASSRAREAEENREHARLLHSGRSAPRQS